VSDILTVIDDRKAIYAILCVDEMVADAVFRFGLPGG